MRRTVAVVVAVAVAGVVDFDCVDRFVRKISVFGEIQYDVMMLSLFLYHKFNFLCEWSAINQSQSQSQSQPCMTSRLR